MSISFGTIKQHAIKSTIILATKATPIQTAKPIPIGTFKYGRSFLSYAADHPYALAGTVKNAKQRNAYKAIVKKNKMSLIALGDIGLLSANKLTNV